MAIIEDCLGTRCVILSDYFRIKCSPVSSLNSNFFIEANNDQVIFYWSNTSWWVLNDSSGMVFFEDKTLKPGERLPLLIGQGLSIGDNRHNRWCMLDSSPPRKNMVFLSDNDEWCVHGEGKPLYLCNGDWVVTERYRWRLCAIEDGLSGRESGAIKPIQAVAPAVCFEVSTDEEHVMACVEIESETINLYERVHHYLLVLLARIKLQDYDKGYDISACGWVDMNDLSKMLGLDISHINIQIYRARKQIAEAVFLEDDLPDIVERRSGSVRLGGWSFKILSGSKQEGVMKLA